MKTKKRIKVTGSNMTHILNITLPKSWQELSDKQLRFVFRLLNQEYSLIQIKTLCLLKWAKLHVIESEGMIFKIKHKGIKYPVSSQQIADATSALDWLGDVPGYPVRLSRIAFHRPVRADLQDVSFEDFLTLDNLYQGHLQTRRRDLLVEMAKILYKAKRINLRTEEEICIFYWFTSVKQMFANMFRHFFKSVSTDGAFGSAPSFQQLQEAMNTQIRALTGGDITKEKEVLAMDCWRALTELDAKAKDYEDMQKTARP